MKGIILIANGFEETEAIVTIDIIRRANIEIHTISLMESNDVLGAHNILIKTDNNFKNIDYKDYDFIVLPGGKAVFTNLLDNSFVDEVINYFYDSQKLIAAICAAPMVLGKNKILNNKNYTCFKGCESDSYNGEFKNVGCTIDGNVITAKSMYYTIDFALEIIKILKGEKVFLQIKDEIMSK